MNQIYISNPPFQPQSWKCHIINTILIILYFYIIIVYLIPIPWSRSPRTTPWSAPRSSPIRSTPWSPWSHPWSAPDDTNSHRLRIRLRLSTCLLLYYIFKKNIYIINIRTICPFPTCAISTIAKKVVSASTNVNFMIVTCVLRWAEIHDQLLYKVEVRTCSQRLHSMVEY